MFRLIFFVLLHQIIFSQIFWKAGGETGYYNSSGDFLQSEEEILTRLNLKGGYNFKAGKNSAKIDFQLRPELYGFKNKLQITKIAIDGIYSHLGNTIDWTITIAANKYLFSGDIIDFSYDSFLLSGQIFYFIKPKISFTIKTGFAYRSFNRRDAVNLDILFSEIDYVYACDSFTKMSCGLYLEKFNLKKKIVDFFNPGISKNNGARIGPAIGFNHTHNFVFSADYQFLIHDSEFTTYPSFDQWLRIIVGKTIIKNLSAFILVDYYKRNFKYQKTEGITEILYSPVNFENRFYFKLSNSLKPNQKLFLKIGYFDEKLFYRNYSLSGWKGYIGFEIKG